MCTTCALTDDLVLVEAHEIGIEAILMAHYRSMLGLRPTRDAGAGDSVSQMRDSFTDSDYITNSTTGEVEAETLPSPQRRGPVPEEA